MLLYGDAEFRGLENKESKNGNKYKILRFEGDGGEVFPFYYRNNTVFDVSVNDLVKGHNYDLAFGYHYNSYDRRYQLDLLNVLKDTDIE